MTQTVTASAVLVRTKCHQACLQTQATNAAMAVFSPLDTNVIPGFQYNNAGTPLSTFPNLGPRAALASWSKKPVDTVSALPAASLAGHAQPALKIVLEPLQLVMLEDSLCSGDSCLSCWQACCA